MSRPPSGVQLTLPSIPIDEGSRPASRAPSSTITFASSRRGPGGTIGNHPSASRPARRNAGASTRITRSGSGAGSEGARSPLRPGSERPSKSPSSRPQPSQQRRSAPRCAHPIAEVLPSASYSTGFQPIPIPSRSGRAQDVDLGRLLRHERGLPLREDDHAGDQLELRDAARKPNSTNGSWNACRRRRGPPNPARGVGAEDVVVREEVRVSERFDPCAVSRTRPRPRRSRSEGTPRRSASARSIAHRSGCNAAATEGTPMRHRHVHRPSPAPLDARRSLVARGRRQGACRPASVRRRVRVRRPRAPLPAGFASCRWKRRSVVGPWRRKSLRTRGSAVFRGIDRFEGRSSFKSWLFSILLNRARSSARREDRAGRPDSTIGEERFDTKGAWAQPPEPWADRAVDRLVAEKLSTRVHDLLAMLPEAQRQVVVLTDVEELRRRGRLDARTHGGQPTRAAPPWPSTAAAAAR